MDAALHIAMDSGIDLNMIEMFVEDLGQPMEVLPITERSERTKNENYAEVIVPSYSNNLFKEHFRMSHTNFEVSTHFATLQ